MGNLELGVEKEEAEPDGFANLAHIRQRIPDSGLGLQVKVLKTF